MRIRTFVVMVVALAFLTGCTASVFNQPVALSTKSIAGQCGKPVGKVSAEYTDMFFILIPIIHDPRNVYDDLLANTKQKGANAVTDVQFNNKNAFWWIFPGFMFTTWELKGTAVHME